MKHALLLVVLGLVMMLATQVMAVPVTPGGLTIQGQIYCEGDGDPLQWVDIGFPWTRVQPGDPQDLMYCGPDQGYHPYDEMGIREGVYNIPLGTYENSDAFFLGHVVYALDFTVTTTTLGTWSGSESLLLELRGPYTDRDTIYWALAGPFSSEPVHVYIEYPQPRPGYEFRLTIVPDATPLATLLTGVGLFAYRQRRRRA